MGTTRRARHMVSHGDMFIANRSQPTTTVVGL